MKIIVKSLKGDTSIAEVNESTTIFEVKKLVETELNIPANHQTLVLFGKALQDDKTVGHYPKIKDGSKLYLGVKKQETMTVVLTRYLKKFYTDEQCKLIVEEFMRSFQAKVDNLSLDDLERIATAELESA